MNQITELKANLGLIVRGDVMVLKAFMADLDRLLAKRSEVQVIHKHLSASKLWIREGDGMNDGEHDQRIN
jgi:hypothetical protein